MDDHEKGMKKNALMGIMKAMKKRMAHGAKGGGMMVVMKKKEDDYEGEMGDMKAKLPPKEYADYKMDYHNRDMHKEDLAYKEKMEEDEYKEHGMMSHNPGKGEY